MKTEALPQVSFAKWITNKKIIAILLACTFVLYWFTCYANCIDVKDWFIENALIFIAVLFFINQRKKISLGILSLVTIFLFMVLHVYGAQYAYTQNPIGEWLQKNYGFVRNPYDRVVHFSFGLLLIIPLQELLQKKYRLTRKNIYLLSVNIILSVACIFEMIEWTVAEFTTKETGETYVATQGDVWDAHKDIAIAVVGALMTCILLHIAKLFATKVK
jgi:putative membrane protein